MKTILRYLKPFLPRMAGGLSIKFLGTIMDLCLPWILAYLIDNVVPRKDVRLVFLWGGLMALCAALAFAGNVTANRMASGVARDVVRALRHDLFTAVARLSCAHIDRLGIPSLVARLSSDTYNVHRLVSGMQRIGVRAPILLLGGVVITLTLDPVLTLVLAATLPVSVLVITLVSRRGIPLFTGVQEGVEKVARVVRENAMGIRVIKALSREDYEKTRFAQANEELTRRELRSGVIMGLTNPAMFLLLNGGLVAVIIAGAYRVNAGLTPPGVILAFLTYFTIILNATLSITRMFVMASRGSASGNRIGEVLAIPPDLTLGSRDHREDGFHLSFEDVSFSYYEGASGSPGGGEEKNAVIQGVSFGLRRGETLGILGETGSGKSTLVSLLLRFYDPGAGRIRLKGDDIRGIPPEEFYAHFGVVLQKDTLFADTVGENVAFGRPLDGEAVKRSLAAAQAEDFVAELPGGVEYDLASRGVNLSGGQRQRLLIARALAGCEGGAGAGEKILILDDASSALDYRTDAALRRALREDYAGLTTIIVAQRVSSVKRADHIMVLERGRVSGYGTHEELLETCALYREISQTQMGDDEGRAA